MPVRRMLALDSGIPLPPAQAGMKLARILVVAASMLPGCGADDVAPPPVRTHAARASAPTIESLRRVIVPPNGTAKADVDAVFAAPRVSETLTGKGSSADYPMHTYVLLPPRPGAEFRAFLHVTYRDDRVYRAGINHLCVSKNLRIDPGARVDHAKEERGVLEDLLLIEETFGGRLSTASWNR
jgi:hypothetical protein